MPLFLLGESLGLASQGLQIEGVRPSHAVESKQLRPDSTDLNVSLRSEKYLLGTPRLLCDLTAGHQSVAGSIGN